MMLRVRQSQILGYSLPSVCPPVFFGSDKLCGRQSFKKKRPSGNCSPEGLLGAMHTPFFTIIVSYFFIGV
ncbi:MAG: hypothetical protein LBT29_00295 [Flavobacteriaceae bacterium]|nr:hypothetical protein [Flavobacteriaceae bacterium]